MFRKGHSLRGDDRRNYLDRLLRRKQSVKRGYSSRTINVRCSSLTIGDGELEPFPTLVNCPFCESRVRSVTYYETGCKTHCVACFLLIFLCWLCIPLPYFLNHCKYATNFCGVCGQRLGRTRKV